MSEKKCPKCPNCGHSLYSFYHTPATDHPELGMYYFECTLCDYEDDEGYTKDEIDNLCKIKALDVSKLSKQDIIKTIKDFSEKVYKDR